jgi:DNA-binding SARP family transcriptional activator
LRFEVLGPLRVIDRNGASFISAPKVELLLAVLLMRADRLVTSEQLITELWNDEPPRRATAGLYVYVSELRKFLDRPGESDSQIVTRPPGYLLRMGTDELDLTNFLDLTKQGRDLAAIGEHEAAVDCFERGIGLWRGSALGDLPSGPIIGGSVTWLAEERLECVELALDGHLHLGRHRQLIGRLYSLIAEYPLRESFYRQLMLALYRAERRADALKVYQTARRTLNRELGLEPCRSLQKLHQAILAGDAALEEYATAR